MSTSSQMSLFGSKMKFVPSAATPVLPDELRGSKVLNKFSSSSFVTLYLQTTLLPAL